MYIGIAEWSHMNIHRYNSNSTITRVTQGAGSAELAEAIEVNDFSPGAF